MGDDDALPDSVTSNLEGLTKEACEPLTVTQIKRIRSLIDEAIEKVTSHEITFLWDSHNLTDNISLRLKIHMDPRMIA